MVDATKIWFHRAATYGVMAEALVEGDGVFFGCFDGQPTLLWDVRLFQDTAW
jgi:hypothetical protein